MFSRIHSASCSLILSVLLLFVFLLFFFFLFLSCYSPPRDPSFLLRGRITKHIDLLPACFPAPESNEALVGAQRNDKGKRDLP
jgi:hypothetical protein